MFLGEYTHAVDVKGRVFIPAKFRDGLGESFVVTKSTDTCLSVYPLSEWEKYCEKINALPRTQSIKARRFLFSNADTVGCDSQGRALISASLREYAKISKNAYIIGLGSYIEIWAEDEWDSEKNSEDPAEISAMLVELGL